jgi:DNA-binding MarR family transcriptional regulator
MSEQRGQPGSLRGLNEVDRIVHEPARLMILMYLYAVEQADFVFLLSATALTGGNLSSHLTKLEQAGYVQVEKGYIGKKPHTLVRLTDAGRQAVDDYRNTMQAALVDAKK